MITRERLLALSAENQMGGTVLFQPTLPDAAEVLGEQLIQMVGDEGDNGPWTVTLSGPGNAAPNGIPTPNVGGSPDLFARVFYSGSKGGVGFVDVDWSHGAQITVFGCQVSVQAINFRRIGAPSVGQLSAWLSPGARAPGMPNQRTLRFNENAQYLPGTIPALATAIVSIPQMARACQHIAVASATLSRNIEVLDGQSNIIHQFSYSNSTGRVFPEWGGADKVPLPTQAAAVRIRNNDAVTAMTSAACVFYLAV